MFALFIFLVTCANSCAAFTFPVTSHTALSNGCHARFWTTSTVLQMAGGLKKQRRHAELAKKMAEAKAARKRGGESTGPSSKDETRLNDEEMRKRNDMKRFEDLLDRESATSDNLGGGYSYLTEAQEEEEANAGYAGIDRIFEGDPAPTSPFEGLVEIKSENAIGKGGAGRLVPWLHRNTARHKDYLVIVADPRMKSPELRQTTKALEKELPDEILKRLIVVNADSPAENRRWVKKNNVPKVEIFSDENRDWMREYTVLAKKGGWTINMFVIADGRVQKLVRDLDVYVASKVIKNAVKSMTIL